MGARGLILLPSRELALQTQKVVQELGRRAGPPTVLPACTEAGQTAALWRLAPALRFITAHRFTSLRTAMLVGGDSMEAQFAELASNPDVIVATPGAARGAPPPWAPLPSQGLTVCSERHARVRLPERLTPACPVQGA